MSYVIDNASVSSISTDCYNGYRMVAIHFGAKYDAGFWGNSKIEVWVSEDITDIEEIKKEAMKLTKSVATAISEVNLSDAGTP